MVRFYQLIIFLCYFFTETDYAASHHPQTFLAQVHGSAHEGEQIVQHYCALCHAATPQIPIGAPRMHVQEDWAWRIKAGLQQLFQHTSEGYQAMPARGGCLECSDEQLLLAIKAMLPLSDK